MRILVIFPASNVHVTLTPTWPVGEIGSFGAVTSVIYKQSRSGDATLPNSISCNLSLSELSILTRGVNGTLWQLPKVVSVVPIFTLKIIIEQMRWN
jgi:hypothetical protein